MASLADGWTQKAIGGTFPSGSPVACASRNSSTIDSFVIGTDGKVYNSYWTTGNDWSGINDDWRDIGGDFTPGSKVTAIARSPDNMDLFVVGKDGKVYSAYWYTGGDWSGVPPNGSWTTIGDDTFPTGAEVSAVSRTQDNVDIFVVGTDGAVYTSYWYTNAPGWSTWRSLNGKFPNPSKIACVSRTQSNIDVFVSGSDGQVYTSYWVEGSDYSSVTNGSWGAIGGSFAPGGELSAVAYSADNLDVFAVGTDGVAYAAYWYLGAEGWSSWGSIGGKFASGASISVVERGTSILDVFVNGTDNSVFHSHYDGKSWSGIDGSWDTVSTASTASARVSAVARDPNNLDSFVVGDDGKVTVAYWTAES